MKIDKIHSATKEWGVFAVISLAVSYLYQLTILFGSEIIPGHAVVTIFSAYKNLSFVIWPFAAARAFLNEVKFDQSLYIAWAGLLLMVISPIFSERDVASTGGIVMVHNLCFILGTVTVFFYSFFSTIFAKVNSHDKYIICVNEFIITSLFGISYYYVRQITYQMDIYSYYCFLLRSGSHALRFFSTEMMMISWIFLTQNILKRDLYYKQFCNWILWLNILLIIPIFYMHFAASIDSAEVFEFFGNYTKYAVLVSPIILFTVLLSEYRAFINSPNMLYFIFSVLLFLIEIFSSDVIFSSSSLSIALLGMIQVNMNSKHRPYFFIIGEFISTLCNIFYGGDILLDVMNSTSLSWFLISLFTCGKILSTIGLYTFMIVAISRKEE